MRIVILGKAFFWNLVSSLNKNSLLEFWLSMLIGEPKYS